MRCVAVIGRDNVELSKSIVNKPVPTGKCGLYREKMIGNLGGTAPINRHCLKRTDVADGIVMVGHTEVVSIKYTLKNIRM